MRVLTVVHSLDRGGGIESLLLRFFRTVDKTDLELEVCCLGGHGGTLAHGIEELGVRIWTVAKGRFPTPTVRSFHRELSRRGAYDVVHSHVWQYSGPILTAAARAGTPVRVAHFHSTHAGHNNDLPRRMYDRWMRRMVLRAATGIVACSWDVLRVCFPTCWDRDVRMGVVRLGIPLQAFANAHTRDEVRREFNIAPDAPVIGHVGRFVWQKNHEGLIQIARRVCDRRPEAVFLLVGDGPLHPRIVEMARRANLSSNVLFAGLRSDVPRLLSAMDVFTLPSVAEGFGLVAIEAQAAGLPVVASALGGIKEAVAPAFHGYLREPHDAAELAGAILTLLDEVRADPSLRKRARDFGRQFTIENSVAAMLAAWGRPGAVAPPDPCAWAAPAGVA